MKYNLFNDYMDKPEVSSGLFTDDFSHISKSEKKEIKRLFQTAQDSGSLMWQTVLSFDNQWLEQQGLYNASTRMLDEERIREYTRGAIKTLLEKESMQNAVWTASIHYDTDNIHVHTSIVEPHPMRKTTMRPQYEFIHDPNGEYIRLSNGAYVQANERNRVNKFGVPYPSYARIPMMEFGKQVMAKEYDGKFKQSSINAYKKYVIDHILDEKENNTKINRIIRDQIVKAKKKMEISNDQDLAKQFIKIHKALPRPENGNRNLWKYNANIMEPLRPEIDHLTDMYLQKYHKSDYDQLQMLLYEQSERYSQAYGDTGRDFASLKNKELYERMGNAILAEIRTYDKEVTVPMSTQDKDWEKIDKAATVEGNDRTKQEKKGENDANQ